MNIVRRSLLFLEQFLFPNTCPFCGEMIEYDKHCCEKCAIKVENQKMFFTEYSNHNGQEPDVRIKLSRFPYSEDFSNCIKELKYKGNFRCAQHSAYFLEKMIVDKNLYFKIDVIIASPMAFKKYFYRGFNQSFIISKYLSKSLNKKLLRFALIKKKHTQEQHTLSLKDRKENLKGAFVCSNPKKIKGKNILFIDDVTTTGNTALECAKVLRENGANSVIAMFVCKTLHVSYYQEFCLKTLPKQSVKI